MTPDRLRNVLIALLVPVVLAVTWEVAVRTGIAPGRLMPPPSRLLTPHTRSQPRANCGPTSPQP